MMTFFTILATPVSSAGLEVDVIGDTNGTIVIDLFEDIAPLHTESILAYAEAGKYDDIPFRNTSGPFVWLGYRAGDGLRQSRSDYEFENVPAELSDFPVERGVVLAIRGRTPGSAKSLFYIMRDSNPFNDRFNGPYTVIGVVTEGMEIVDAITFSHPEGSSFATYDPDVISAVRITDCVIWLITISFAAQFDLMLVPELNMSRMKVVNFYKWVLRYAL